MSNISIPHLPRNADTAEIISHHILQQIGMDYWANHWKLMHRNLFSMLALQKIGQ